MNRKYVPRPRLIQTEKQKTPFKFTYEGERRVQEFIQKQSPVNFENFDLFKCEI